MKKKLLIMLLSLSVLAGITACGSENKEEAPKSESKEESVDVSDESEQVTEAPTDLTGTWKSEANEGSWMEAVISADTISIDWISDDGDTRSIYWIGTYAAPTEYVDDYTWTSERDKEQTDNALLASTDDTKDFSYSSGKLSYEVSFMGTTTKMELSKE